jgi:hypothetical protein
MATWSVINGCTLAPHTDHLLFQVTMSAFMCKRDNASYIPTFKDMRPYTTWNMCIWVYQKIYVERFSVSRKRLSMVLLDEKVILTPTFVFICSK